jgi:hypothetical protein
MRVAALALALFSAGFLLHWVLWRIRVPRRQSAALLAILLAALPVGLATVTFVPALQFLRPHGVWEVVQVSTFHIALTLAYVVAYSAIEGRSPSMTLLSYAADARDNGRTRAELEAVLRGDDPVTARLDALVRDNMIGRDGDCYALTAKGWAWARCFGSFRSLLKMQKGG